MLDMKLAGDIRLQVVKGLSRLLVKSTTRTSVSKDRCNLNSLCVESMYGNGGGNSTLGVHLGSITQHLFLIPNSGLGYC